MPSDENAGVSAEMPRYKSHKEVHALKIVSASPGPEPGSVLLHFEHPFAPKLVDGVWASKRIPEGQPAAPGYLVVYEDGYTSWSPVEAFESGYTRI